MKLRGIQRPGRQNDAPPGGRRAQDRAGTLQRAISPRVREHITRLVVDVGNRADAWRDAALDAELAYRWWQGASNPERADAAAVYLAAIEREEKAAAEYSRALEVCSKTTPEAACRPL